MTKYQSWPWLGGDFVERLGSDYDVRVFDADNPPPHSDVVVMIKRRLHRDLMENWLRQAENLVYMPVDYYESPAEIEEDEWFLGRCAALLLHSDRLLPYLHRHQDRIWRIEHYNKFGLDSPVKYRESGEILWIGVFEHVPYLLEWAAEHRPPFPLRVLSDIDNPRAVEEARDVAAGIGVDITIGNGTVNGIVLEKWSPRIQTRRLSQCKAAVDIKGCRHSFKQLTKPATKGQKYVVSGVPFAVNADSFTHEYFAKRGLDFAQPHEYERWFSREYHEEIVAHSDGLRRELSIDSICNQLHAVIRTVLTGSVPAPARPAGHPVLATGPLIDVG